MPDLARFLASAALCLLAASAFGQASMSIQIGHAAKAVVGLPFIADQTVRTVQHLASGTPLTHVAKGHVLRSADGVERLDGDFPSTDPAKPGSTTLAWIIDIDKHSATILNSTLKTASLRALPENSAVSVRFLPLTLSAGSERIKLENPVTIDLGKRTQGFLELVGRRTTSTIPAGKIGNDQPLVVSVEIWFSPQLKLIVKEVEEDPRVGERTYELTNIRAEEPDPELFTVPAGYTTKLVPVSIPPSLGTPAGPGTEHRTKQIEDALNDTGSKIKNTVAYALANNNDHLADAQTLAEQAVLIEEQKASDVVSAGDVAKSFEQMTSLSSFWDTLGWVYYREGNQNKAEGYVRAAWELKPNPEYASHLGRIYEAELRPADAVSVYRMALGVKNSPAAQDFFQTRLTKLSHTPEPLAMEIMTTLPPFHLAGKTKEFEAIVDILLTRDQPPGVSFLSGDAELKKPLTDAIQSALAKDLPDNGPERILRRARVNCTAGELSSCTLHFLTSPAAGNAGFN